MGKGFMSFLSPLAQITPKGQDKKGQNNTKNTKTSGNKRDKSTVKNVNYLNLFFKQILMCTLYMLTWWLFTSHLQVYVYVRQYYIYFMCFNVQFPCVFMKIVYSNSNVQTKQTNFDYFEHIYSNYFPGTFASTVQS